MSRGWNYIDAVIAVEMGRVLRSMMCGGVFSAEWHRKNWYDVSVRALPGARKTTPTDMR